MSKTPVITLMFHRVNDQNQGFHPQRFARYLHYLTQNFPIVVPGEPIPDVPLAICLTFDDAYYDFYHDVYPLLRQHQIKALLAVPVHYILEKTSLPPQVRLSVPYPQGMKHDLHQTNVPFCTWEELKEMVDSGWVVIASHGFKHEDLSNTTVDFTQEIIFSQKMLSQKLNSAITCFVYPYGRTSSQAHSKVCQIYEYGIRIGNALNQGWGTHGYIYRINADPLWTVHRPIDQALIHKLTFKYWLNRLRTK